MSRLIVLQHLEREGPGLFLKIAQERGMPIKTFRLDLGDTLPKLFNGDLLLVLGGPMGIRDINTGKYPWLIKELNLIKEALIKQIPTIGICLVAQLLAYASGGEIEVLLEESSSKPLPEIGWSTIYAKIQDKPNLLCTFLQNPLSVLHWHGDRVILPASAELIASSSRCKEQLFKIGSLAYGLQFHVEIDDEMVLRWIEEDYEFIVSSLGDNAKSILENQQMDYGNKTLKNRLLFLNKIFDLLGF